MKHYDNHEYEIRLNNEGYSLIAGTDEVGRGPLAGPVVVASVIMPADSMIEGVNDSKKIIFWCLQHFFNFINRHLSSPNYFVV